jgi:hypothetical protein
MGRRWWAKPRGRGFDAALAVLVLVVGVGALVAVYAYRPAEFRGAQTPVGPPPVTIETGVRDEGGTWVAWAVDRPTCTARAATEKTARMHVAQAAQLGMRPECQIDPAATAPPGTGLPPAGWYPDPRRELGEDSYRFWDGTGWTGEVTREATEEGDRPLGEN